MSDYGAGATELQRAAVQLLHMTTVGMSLHFLAGQPPHMRVQGVESAVLSSPGEDLERFAREQAVVAIAVEMPRRITPLSDVLALWRLRSVLRSIRPIILHAHTPKAGLLGMVAGWIARIPVRIYHVHGLPLLTANGVRRLLLMWSERVACSLAHRVLCVSHSIRTAAVEMRLCAPEKVVVLAGGSINGVDAAGRFDPNSLSDQVRLDSRARHGIPPGATVVGFIGRLVRDKGIVELAAAWRLLRADFPDAHLLLVGPWEPQDPVPAEVRRQLEADARVHFAGMDWDTPPLYAAMDLVVLPTYREGFPNVPLEAAAMRLPVVATQVPGCVDAVEDGVTGTLVPPRHAGALAEAMRRYLADPALRRRHGEAGRERVLRDFRQEVIWEAMYQEYRRLLAAAGLPLPDGRPASDRPAGSTRCAPGG